MALWPPAPIGPQASLHGDDNFGLRARRFDIGQCLDQGAR